MAFCRGNGGFTSWVVFDPADVKTMKHEILVNLLAYWDPKLVTPDNPEIFE